MKKKCKNCTYYNIGLAKKCNITHEPCEGYMERNHKEGNEDAYECPIHGKQKEER